MRRAADLVRVLVCDDDRVQQQVMETFLGELDIHCRVVGTGEAAVCAVQEEDFDLVLMDRVLPGMDGLDATRRIRQMQQQQGKWIPVLLLTSLSAGCEVVEGFDAGADDCLTKPISVALLQAKLRVFIRLSRQERLLRQRSEALTRYRDLVEREKVFGTHVLASMTRRADLRDPDLFVWQRAADQLSGDLLAYRRTASSRYLLLADAMGHGLSAAFATILAADLFYAMTAKALPIAEIAVELNRKLSSLVPPGYLVSGTLVQATACEVQVINAGMPAALMLRDGGQIHEFRSINLPFAVQRDQWSPKVESVAYRRGDRLVIMSDGLTEAAANAARGLVSESSVSAYLDTEFPANRQLVDDATAGILTL